MRVSVSIVINQADIKLPSQDLPFSSRKYLELRQESGCILRPLAFQRVRERRIRQMNGDRLAIRIARTVHTDLSLLRAIFYFLFISQLLGGAPLCLQVALYCRVRCPRNEGYPCLQTG